MACWPILVNLRAFENNQGWEAKRRQRNSNEPFSRKAVYWGLWNLPPPVWWLYLPAFFLQEEETEGERGGSWKFNLEQVGVEKISEWLILAREKLLVGSNDGWGGRIAPSSSLSSLFRHQLPRACFGPLSPKVPTSPGAKKPPGVASFGFASPFFPFLKRSKTDGKKGALASSTAPAELCPP